MNRPRWINTSRSYNYHYFQTIFFFWTRALTWVNQNSFQWCRMLGLPLKAKKHRVVTSTIKRSSWNSNTCLIYETRNFLSLCHKGAFSLSFYLAISLSLSHRNTKTHTTTHTHTHQHSCMCIRMCNSPKSMVYLINCIR